MLEGKNIRAGAAGLIGIGALFFILVRSFKNRLIEVIHKPGKLILYLLCFFALGAIILMPLLTNPQNNAQMDIIWLKGIYFAFLMIFVILSVQKGLSNGDIIFQMQDVNLLFVSPVNPKFILIYGLTQMTKMAFLAGFFILFQSNTLSTMFGKGFSAVLILFFSFILTMVLLSILSLVIYNLTNSRPRRKRIVRILTVVVFVPLLLYAGIEFLKTGNPAAAMENVMNSWILAWTPIAGWGAEAATALIAGDLGMGWLFTAISLLAGAFLVAYILLGNIDYYEDVLVATETAFERKRAIDEGQANAEALSSRKTKVAKTGVSGCGANALFYKHLRETTRANALGLLAWPTVFMIVAAAILAFFMREDGGAAMMILQILMWMQVFMIGTGRGMKELTVHYIYLIPESSLQKIVWGNLETVAKVLMESTLLFGIASIAAGESPAVAVGCIAVFTMFSLMLISINFISMRWFGTDVSAGILIMLYMLAVIIIMLPGLIPALIIGFMTGGSWGTVCGLIILAVWEFAAAMICFALAKSVLHNCDIETRSK